VSLLLGAPVTSAVPSVVLSFGALVVSAVLLVLAVEGPLVVSAVLLVLAVDGPLVVSAVPSVFPTLTREKAEVIPETVSTLPELPKPHGLPLYEEFRSEHIKAYAPVGFQVFVPSKLPNNPFPCALLSPPSCPRIVPAPCECASTVCVCDCIV
jgi:hypothetical protein